MDLTGDAFVKALQSETITLLVGKDPTPFTISKDLLCMKSAFIAQYVAKSEGTLRMPEESVTAVKMFIRWCYQEHLQTFHSNATYEEKSQQKEALIDLWLFAERYGISKLQNQTMHALVAIFNTPNLLTKTDISYIWHHTNGEATPLRSLAVYALVSQIEDGNGENEMSPEDLDAFEEMKLPGLLHEVYASLSVWLSFKFKGGKREGHLRWGQFVRDGNVLREFVVEEEEEEGKVGDGRARTRVKIEERSTPVVKVEKRGTPIKAEKKKSAPMKGQTPKGGAKCDKEIEVIEID